MGDRKSKDGNDGAGHGVPASVLPAENFVGAQLPHRYLSAN